jgi:tripartite-type tricarboxylate transporter receptor subunit TctC
MKFVLSLLLLGTFAGLSPLAAAQSTQLPYPNKPIRMIAPSGAGGPVDVICRAVSQGLSGAGPAVHHRNRPAGR